MLGCQPPKYKPPMLKKVQNCQIFFPPIFPVILYVYFVELLSKVRFTYVRYQNFKNNHLQNESIFSFMLYFIAIIRHLLALVFLSGKLLVSSQKLLSSRK
jgi:hypothetical protein